MSWFAPLAQLAGAGVQAGGALAAGGQTAAVDRYNAQISTVNAANAVSAGDTNAAIIAQNSRLAAGRAAAAYGAGGVEMTGSPLAVMASLSAAGELNKRITLRNSALQAQGDTQQAAVSTAEGSAASAAGDIKAAGSLLTGTAQFANATNALGWYGTSAGTSPGSS